MDSKFSEIIYTSNASTSPTSYEDNSNKYLQVPGADTTPEQDRLASNVFSTTDGNPGRGRATSESSDGSRRGSSTQRERHASNVFSTADRVPSRSRASSESSYDGSRRGSSANSSTRRKRDIFWQNSLWDFKGKYPEGPRVRAMSQSTDVLHPEVAEERMRAIYRPWRN